MQGWTQRDMETDAGNRPVRGRCGPSAPAPGSQRQMPRGQGASNEGEGAPLADYVPHRGDGLQQTRQVEEGRTHRAAPARQPAAGVTGRRAGTGAGHQPAAAWAKQRALPTHRTQRHQRHETGDSAQVEAPALGGLVHCGSGEGSRARTHAQWASAACLGEARPAPHGCPGAGAVASAAPPCKSPERLPSPPPHLARTWPAGSRWPGARRRWSPPGRSPAGGRAGGQAGQS